MLKKLKSFFVYDASNSSNSTMDKASVLDSNTLRHLSSFLKLNQDPEQDWHIVDSIGDGAFGKIYKVQHRLNKKLAALKQVAVEDEDSIEEFCTEVKVLCRVKHQNVVSLFEAYYHASKIWMFLEFCQIGSVDSIMQELERPLNESQISCILTQLCRALTYLHEELLVIHRDVKAANVLLNSDAYVKLADFGVSAICESGARRNSFIGSPYWMAPEVINCETSKEDTYDFMVDIWSLGIMSIEMAQMDPPWNEVNPNRVTLKILRNAPPFLDEPNRWSKEFKDFLGCCLKKEPRERQPASQLLKHKFLLSSKDLGPLRELIAEVMAEVKVECMDIDGENGQVVSLIGNEKMNSGELEDLEREYLPSLVISTNIDEELAKHNIDHSDKGSPRTASATSSKNTWSNQIENNEDQGGSASSTLFVQNPWTQKSNNQSNDSDHALDDKSEGTATKPLQQHVARQSKASKNSKPPPPPKPDLISNENFSFGESSLGSRSSRLPPSFSSIGKEARANHKKGQQQQQLSSGVVKEGLKVALFGALASKQRLIGRSEEEGKALEMYRDDEVHPLLRQDDDSNDGDISSIAVTGINNDDDDDDYVEGEKDEIHDVETFRRDKPRYKSLIKTRVYTYEGRPMTSKMSKVIRQGQEERSRMDRHNKKMDMRAMQLLQMSENKHRRNLVHHFRKQTKDVQRNFRSNVKKCLKSYQEELDRLSRLHKQSLIKLQLQHDQEFNEVHRRVKVQQEKDYKSLQSMLKMDLKRLKDKLASQQVNRMVAMTTIERKEMENLEVLRTYDLQQKDQMSRLIDQLRFKHRVQQGNAENDFLNQKHDLYRACEGSIWKLEEGHLHQKKQLIIEQLKQMHELQLEQARSRNNQEMEHLTKSQAASRSNLLRLQEDEERRLSKQLKQQKRLRTNLFKEALNVGDMKDGALPRKGHIRVEDGGRHGNGGDSGYMSLEREQIKEFERNERRRIDETFRGLRLEHRSEKQAFELRCSEEVTELRRALQERVKQLEYSSDVRLKEEESKDRLERARWQQSLVMRKRVLEEELEKQKDQQERFFRNVLRSCSTNHISDRRYFETYDRNFDHRKQGKIILNVDNHSREFKSLDHPQNQMKAPFRVGSEGHLEEPDELSFFPIWRAHNSPLYKSTPDFVSYWSGLDDEGSSSTDDDQGYGGVDDGHDRRFKGMLSDGAKRLATQGFHSDEEMSTCL